MKSYVLMLGLLAITAGACHSSRKSAGTASGSQATDTDNSLLNKRWVLRELPGTALPQLERDIFLTFRIGSTRVDGFSGCNSFSGKYEVDGRKLKISQVMSTKMWCDNGPVEQKVMALMDTVNHYSVNGDELKLFRDNEMLGRFEAVYLK